MPEEEINVDAPDLEGIPKEVSNALAAESPTLPASEAPPEQAEGSQEAPEASEGSDVWEKRYKDTQRWAQQIQSEKDEFAAKLRDYETKMNRYKEAGVDFSEIDQFLASSDQGVSNTNPMESESMKTMENLQKQQQEMLIQYQYDMAKRDFKDLNPDFKDSDMEELLDFQVGLIAQKERGEYGKIVSSASDIIAEASKRVNSKVNKFVEKGKASATEKREDIKKQAIPDGSTEIRVPLESKEDELDDPERARDYASSLYSHRDKIKQVQKMPVK
jgi:hypothetical protein